MALWDNRLRDKCGLRASTAVIGLTAALGVASPAAAQFPGEKWSVDYVRVEGDAPMGITSAVNFGLRKAGETYFYGGVPTRLVATVRDAAGGIVDVKLIDNRNGSVIGERRGLSFAPVAGDVKPGSSQSRAIANSIRLAALNWMGGLGCGENCAVAINGTANTALASTTPAPSPEPAPAAVEEPKPAPVVQPLAEAKPQAVAVAPETSKPVTKPRAAAKVKPPQTKVAKVSKPKVSAKAPAVAAAPKATKPKAPKVSLATPTVSSARRLDNQTREDIAAITRGVPEPAPRITQSVTEPDIAAVNPTARPTTAVDQSSSLDVGSTSGGVTTPAVPTPDLAEPSAGSAAALAGVNTATDEAVSTAVPDTQPTIASVAPVAQTVEPEAPENTAEVAPQPVIESPAEAVRLPIPKAPNDDAPKDTSPVVARVEDANGQITLVNPATRGTDTSTLPGEATEIPRPTASKDGADDPLLAADVEVVAPEDPKPNAEEEKTGDLDGEVLALADPVAPVPSPSVTTNPPDAAVETVAPATESTDPTPDLSGSPEPTGDTGNEDPVTTVETQVAALDPTAEGPTLANARWVGFTPAVFSGSDQRDGTWISGPFDRKQRTGWITDTATGATTKVTFIWRDAASGGRTATLSRSAAKALGLGQGDVANVAVYLPR